MSSPQAIVQVIYPSTPTSTFNLDYYLNSHIPMVEKLWSTEGLHSWTVTVGDKDGGYHVQAVLTWDSSEAYQQAGHKQEIMGDVKNFTNVKPTRMIGTVVTGGSAAKLRWYQDEVVSITVNNELCVQYDKVHQALQNIKAMFKYMRCR
ncbi:hypothetical protein ANO11243_049540 [Dothideomycetidae sp. 11243]|nr:hypothetical protein ANO11243_049540 [fungal sp. No.11243]